MTTRAYQETYLSSMQSALGDAFDYAISTCGIPGRDFTRLLAASTAARRIENGEPDYLTGKSGAEIAREILRETTGKEPQVAPEPRLGRSAEYWIGWATAYYQWHSGRTFAQIFQVLPYEDLQATYPLLHEADIGKFAEIADARVRERFRETNLKRIRGLYGCTQAELARRSGVGLRSIQMYEQRNKDINKASAETVLRLSRALGCTMEDLIEK